MSRSKHLSFAVLSSFNASGLIMLRTRINVKCFSRESQVTRICNSNLNLSLTDVESEYPVQCSEDGNWRIPTENDDRTDTEGNFTSCNVSSCYHVKPTPLSRNKREFSGSLKSFLVRESIRSRIICSC